MKTGKIKIKAKCFMKIKMVQDSTAIEEVRDVVLSNFSFSDIFQSLSSELNSSEFGYRWRLEGESAAI